MSKLKSAILYEYSTKIKAMVLFYLIQYLIVALIFSIVAISVGGEEIGSNALEFSSVIFISVIGVLGYKEDFKALIQNGSPENISSGLPFVCSHCWQERWRLSIL